MVHAEIKPQNQVLLFKTFSVEEVVEVDKGFVDILPVVCVRGAARTLLAVAILSRVSRCEWPPETATSW